MKENTDSLGNQLKINDFNTPVKSPIIDITKTALYAAVDPAELINETTKGIANTIHESYKEGSFWKKTRKVPASLIATPFMAMGGVAETLYYSGYNVFRNIANTLTNPFTNHRKPIERALTIKKRIEKCD